MKIKILNTKDNFITIVFSSENNFTAYDFFDIVETFLFYTDKYLNNFGDYQNVNKLHIKTRLLDFSNNVIKINKSLLLVRGELKLIRQTKCMSYIVDNIKNYQSLRNIKKIMSDIKWCIEK